MKKEALWYYEFREIKRCNYSEENCGYTTNWQVMTAKEWEKFYIQSVAYRKMEIWFISKRKASLAEEALRRLPDYQKRLEADLNGKD